MQRRGLFPRWLRRAVEAGLFAAILSVGTLVGFQLSSGTAQLSMPPGAAGALLLAPPVLALGVIPVAYPVLLAATRADALFGSVGAFLIAGDLSIIMAGGRLVLEGSAREVPMGLFVAGLGAIAALVGLAAGQLLTPLGFGRRAGAVSAVAAAASSALVVVLVVTLS